MITRLLRDPIRAFNSFWFSLGLPEIIWPNPQQRIARELEKDAIKDVMYASLYHRQNVETAALEALDAVGTVL
jgi:hypothetical protein